MSDRDGWAEKMPAGIAEMFDYVERADRDYVKLSNARARQMVRDAVNGKARAYKDETGAVVVVHDTPPADRS